MMTLLKMPFEGVSIVEVRLIKAPPWMQGQPVSGKFSKVGGFHRNLNSKPTRRKIAASLWDSDEIWRGMISEY